MEEERRRKGRKGGGGGKGGVVETRWEYELFQLSCLVETGRKKGKRLSSSLLFIPKEFSHFESGHEKEEEKAVISFERNQRGEEYSPIEGGEGRREEGGREGFVPILSCHAHFRSQGGYITLFHIAGKGEREGKRMSKFVLLPPSFLFLLSPLQAPLHHCILFV